MKGLFKRKRRLGRHRHGKSKKGSFDYSSHRESIGSTTANAQSIAAKIAPKERSPSKLLVKRKLAATILHLNNTSSKLKSTQTKYKRATSRIKTLSYEKKELLVRLKAQQTTSNNYAEKIMADANAVITELESRYEVIEASGYWQIFSGIHQAVLSRCSPISR